MNNPILALSVFTVLCFGLYLLFRPKGYYYFFLKGKKESEKTIIEDILKQLFHADSENEGVKFKDLRLAEFKAKKALIGIIDQMIKSELIKRVDDFLVLEPKGREYALRIIRAHRLWEKYLAEETGYDKADWHDLAEEKEHELTQDQTNALSNSLGSPRYDPHGDPIPTEKGDYRIQERITLSQFPIDQIGEIVHIEDEPEMVYQQILAENLHIGSQIKIIEKNNERIRFISEGEAFVLTPLVAENIGLRIVQKEEEQDESTRRLSSLKEGEEVEVLGISRECRGANRRRLLDLGFVPGTKIALGISSPLNDPKAYKVRNTDIALRNEQAEYILIKTIKVHEQSGA